MFFIQNIESFLLRQHGAKLYQLYPGAFMRLVAPWGSGLLTAQERENVAGDGAVMQRVAAPPGYCWAPIYAHVFKDMQKHYCYHTSAKLTHECTHTHQSGVR